MHPERQRPLRDERTDTPEADDPQGLSMQLDSLIHLSIPSAGPHAGIGWCDVASLGEEKRHGVFGCTDDVRLGRVDHQDTGRGCGPKVDVVDSHAGATDNLEVRRSGQQFCIDLGGRSDNQPLCIMQSCEQIGTIDARRNVELAMCGESLNAGFCNGFSDNDLRSHQILLLRNAILHHRSASAKPVGKPSRDLE